MGRHHIIAQTHPNPLCEVSLFVARFPDYAIRDNLHLFGAKSALIVGFPRYESVQKLGYTGIC